MRISIFWILILITLLFSNIIFYFINEEYRFFVQKLRHGDSLVETQNIVIDDSIPLPSKSQSEPETNHWSIWETDDETTTTSALEFLESTIQSNTRSRLSSDNIELIPSSTTLTIISLIDDYDIKPINSEEYLFSVTPEYPDPFLQWHSSEVNFYAFSTKTYREVFDIFDVLSFELPITLNEVNNFGDASFFINMDNWWEDGYVRVVFEYENEVFWLKIRNLYYNTIRDTLTEQL